MSRQLLVVTGDAGESFRVPVCEATAGRGRIRAAHRGARAGAGSTWSSTTSSPTGTPTSSGPGYGADADLTFDEVRPEDYDAILLLGGRAPEYLRHDARVLDLVRAFDAPARGCSPSVTACRSSPPPESSPSKHVTAYEHCRWEIEASGATYVSSDQAVRDGHIVTGQTWQSHPDFYRHVFACLGNADA